MAGTLADHRMLQAEGLASQCETPGGEVDELAPAGLSGKAGWRVACLDNQFGQEIAFILARRAQNGLLLTKSILGMHKGPETGCGNALGWNR
jgi:hypothetical protein